LKTLKCAAAFAAVLKLTKIKIYFALDQVTTEVTGQGNTT
jgi:hypothetical protein